MRMFLLYAVNLAVAFGWSSAVAKKISTMLLILFCTTLILSTNASRAAQVTLAWDTNPEPDVAGYRIYYGTASHVYSWFIDVGNATRYTVTDLPDGGTIYFAATAYNTSGIESTYSNEAFWSDISVNLPTSEITIGTKYTITGSGFGDKKGKVLIGNIPMKISSWSADSIIFTAIRVPIPAGPYDVFIKPQPYADISPVILPSALIVMDPEIVSLSSNRGLAGDEITITGNFFGTKKGKVYLEDPVSRKKKTCKVTNWHMEPANGASAITLTVPKLAQGLSYGVEYPLKVTNKIGTAETTFTVNQ